MKYLRWLILFIVYQLAFAGTAGANFYAKHVETGGGGTALDGISCATPSTGDVCIVGDSSLDMAFWSYVSTSTDSAVAGFIVVPTNRAATCSGQGAWYLMRGIKSKNDGSGASTARFYEDYDNGTNYFDLTVPDSIASNVEFQVGRWNINNYVADSDLNIEQENTRTYYHVDRTAWTTNRSFNLPASTGGGMEFVFHIVADAGADQLRAEPDGTDQIIIVTGTAGDYYYGDTLDDMLHLVDCASGEWCVYTSRGTWTEQ